MVEHRLYYSLAYVSATYAFDSTRKPAWIAGSLASNPVAGVILCEPNPLERSDVERIHDPLFVNSIRTGEPLELAESNCFEWDSTVWDMVMAQEGGAVAASIAALEDGVAGSLSTGMHHAYRSKGKGFCTFNGLVLGALAALDRGAGNVLIVDLDAHCGGGTHSLIRDEPRIWQLDLSVSNFDEHDDTDRSVVQIFKSPEQYLLNLQSRLDAIRDVPFGLCIYYSGMDPHELCAFGGVTGFTDAVLARREEVVFEWCRQRQLPVAYMVGGGYEGKKLSRDHLVRLHRMTIESAANSAAKQHSS